MAAKAASSERTYLGPATRFRPSADAKPIGIGAKVTLTDEQYRQLSGLGHTFDPAWVEPSLPLPNEVPDVDKDGNPSKTQEATIPA